MIDEVRVQTQLESELLPMLVYATELMGRAAEADLTAGCVFGGPPHAPACHVSAARLGLCHEDEFSLDRWPEDEGGLFEYLREQGDRDRVFRPRQVMDELSYGRRRFYRRIEAFAAVSDAICLTASLPDHPGAWAAFAILRCDDSPPFSDSLLATLERLRPAVARLLKRGLVRQAQPRGFELKHEAGQIITTPVSTGELLAKLSRTEMHVLNHLRQDMTERRIASEIGRSPHTVHVHVKNIYRKLGVTSRKDLLQLFSD